MNNLTDALLDALRLEVELMTESGKAQTPVSADLKRQLELWGAGICRVVVVGEVKRGKSSFINALLGHRNLVPVGNKITTSSVFKVRYDKKPKYRVHFTEKSGKAPLEVDINDKKTIEDYGTESGNPGNFDEVDYIEACVDSEVLRSGIVLIDTPGLGGMYQYHKEITYTYIPRADAVFFVLASDQPPIGQIEIEYLKKIKQITPFIYFIQTRFTEASSVEAREELKNRNLSLISRALDMPRNSIPYFVLDSELKLDAEEDRDIDALRVSRFPQLMTYLKGVLQNNQQKILATRALWSIYPTLTHIRELLSEKKAFLDATAKGTLKTLEKEIAAKRKELEEWKQSKKSDVLINGINEQFSGLLLQAEQMLTKKCGLDSILRCKLLAELQESRDMKGLEFHRKVIQRKFREDMAEIAYEIDHFMETKVLMLLQNMVRDALSESLQQNLREQDIEFSEERLKFRELKEDVASFLGISFHRSLVHAARQGVSFAGFGGLIATLGSPAIGIGVAVVAFLAGFAFTKMDHLELEVTNAKNLTQADLDFGLAKAKDKINSYIKRKYAPFISQVEEQIKKYITQREIELQDSYEAVQRRMRGETDELLEEQASHQRRKRRYDRIQAVVNKWNDIIFHK